jgi:hypothetical protein
MKMGSKKKDGQNWRQHGAADIEVQNKQTDRQATCCGDILFLLFVVVDEILPH